MLAIFAAVKQEIQGVAKQMKIKNTYRHSDFRIFEGTLTGHEVILVATGMGWQKAVFAGEYAVSKYPISSILSTGVCGGLDEKSKTGDFLLYNTVINEEDTSTILYPDKRLLAIANMGLSKLGLNHGSGNGLTVKKVCSLPDIKRELGARFNAVAVDMESYQLAQIATRNNIPFLVVRPVFDSVNENLTVIDNIVGTNDFLHLKGLAYVLVHPGCVKELMDYRKRAGTLGENLAEFTSNYVGEIS